MAGNPQLKRANSTDEYTSAQVMELAKCMQDPIYFMENYLKVQHPTKGAVPFKLYPYQHDMVDAIHNNRKAIILASRQLGKTTVVAMYILWFAMFQQEPKVCIIASKKMSHATEIMSRIKYSYEELPAWIKAGCKFYNRTSIEFDNGSKIKCEATSANTGRGESPSILMVDEIAFIPKRIQDEMWGSLAPALSTGGKFVLTSTPNGDSDLFSSLWRGAMSGTNDFHPLQVMWYQHPDRGEAYYKEMLGQLGEVRTRVELDCEFLSSDSLLINTMKLQQIRPEAPTFVDMGFKFWCEQHEIGGRGKTYLVGVDPATGSGNDLSAIQVFEFPSLRQIAEWSSSELKIPEFYAKIKWILEKLNRPVLGQRSDVLWTFERNGIGEAIAALYMNDANMPDAELISDKPGTYGVYTTQKTKVLSCLQLKMLIEKAVNGLQIKSERLLFELKNFVAKGQSYEAKSGATDDRVMATVQVIRLLKRLADYDDRAFSTVNQYVEASDGDEATFDEPMPIG